MLASLTRSSAASGAAPVAKAVILTRSVVGARPASRSVVTDQIVSAARAVGLADPFLITSMLGVGDALALAERHVGREPFALLLPDRFVRDDEQLVARLLESYTWSRQSVVAVPSSVDPRHLTAAELECYGRFVLTADIFDALDTVSPDPAGERPFGDALLLLARQRRLKVVAFDAEHSGVAA